MAEIWDSWGDTCQALFGGQSYEKEGRRRKRRKGLNLKRAASSEKFSCRIQPFFIKVSCKCNVGYYLFESVCRKDSFNISLFGKQGESCCNLIRLIVEEE